VIELFRARGAGDFTLLQDYVTLNQSHVLFENAARLLIARN